MLLELFNRVRIRIALQLALLNYTGAGTNLLAERSVVQQSRFDVLAHGNERHD